MLFLPLYAWSIPLISLDPLWIDSHFLQKASHRPPPMKFKSPLATLLSFQAAGFIYSYDSVTSICLSLSHQTGSSVREALHLILHITVA